MGTTAQKVVRRRKPDVNPAGKFELSMSGSGQFVSSPVHGLFNLKQDEWTCEVWGYCTGFTNNSSRIIVFSATRSIGLIPSGTGFVLNIFGGANVLASTTSGSQVTNAWRHYCLMKKGGVTYLFVQGVMLATNATAWWDDANTQIGFGGNISPSGGSGFPGKMSNARFLSYAAYDIAGFTPPKTPPIGGAAALRTELLLLNDSTIKDNSKNGLTPVTTGTPTMAAGGPFP